MLKEVWKFLVERDTWQSNKSENIPQPRLVRPLHILDQKWETICIDFIEGLPLSEGKDTIFGSS
jgi:hypothetical protein